MMGGGVACQSRGSGEAGVVRHGSLGRGEGSAGLIFIVSSSNEKSRMPYYEPVNRVFGSEID